MKRNVPAKTQNTSPWYRCPTRGCNCRTIKCDFLEAEVVKAMSQWWGEYTIKIKEDKVSTNGLYGDGIEYCKRATYRASVTAG